MTFIDNMITKINNELLRKSFTLILVPMDCDISSWWQSPACKMKEVLLPLLQKLSGFQVRLESGLYVRWVRVCRAQLLQVSECSICPNQCTLISTTKNGMFCQAVILNTVSFCIPTHNESCRIYLFIIAFGLCLLYSFVQPSKVY